MSQASVVLTIDTKNLRDLFLPSVARKQKALDYMNSQCLRAVRKKSFDDLNEARCALMLRVDGLVEEVCKRGGLLLIGGKF